MLVFSDHISAPVCLVCGEANVGKSTFCRFVMNYLLNRCVHCMEFLTGDSLPLSLSLTFYPVIQKWPIWSATLASQSSQFQGS